jgi:hypothetical protein
LNRRHGSFECLELRAPLDPFFFRRCFLLFHTVAFLLHLSFLLLGSTGCHPVRRFGDINIGVQNRTLFGLRLPVWHIVVVVVLTASASTSVGSPAGTSTGDSPTGARRIPIPKTTAASSPRFPRALEWLCGVDVVSSFVAVTSCRSGWMGITGRPRDRNITQGSLRVQGRDRNGNVHIVVFVRAVGITPTMSARHGIDDDECNNNDNDDTKRET